MGSLSQSEDGSLHRSQVATGREKARADKDCAALDNLTWIDTRPWHDTSRIMRRYHSREVPWRSKTATHRRRLPPRHFQKRVIVGELVSETRPCVSWFKYALSLPGHRRNNMSQLGHGFCHCCSLYLDRSQCSSKIIFIRSQQHFTTPVPQKMVRNNEFHLRVSRKRLSTSNIFFRKRYIVKFDQWALLLLCGSCPSIKECCADDMKLLKRPRAVFPGIRPKIIW